MCDANVLMFDCGNISEVVMVIKNSSVRIGIGSDVAVRVMLLYAMVCDSCCNIGVVGADTARSRCSS